MLRTLSFYHSVNVDIFVLRIYGTKNYDLKISCSFARFGKRTRYLLRKFDKTGDSRYFRCRTNFDWF